MPSLIKHATPELVLLTWLRGLPGLDGQYEVATDVPDAAAWKYGLFVRIQGTGGNIDPAVPLRDAFFRVSFLAKPKDQTSQPPWNVANTLAEDVVSITYSDAAYGTLTLPGTFPNVFLSGVEALTLPSRVVGNPQNLARYDVDLSVPYIEEN